MPKEKRKRDGRQKFSDALARDVITIAQNYHEAGKNVPWRNMVGELSGKHKTTLSVKQAKMIAYNHRQGLGYKHIVNDSTDDGVHFIEAANRRLIHEDKKVPGKLTFDETIDVFEDGQGIREKVSIRQLTAKVVIKAQTPIALTFISDAHLGSPHTDYKGFREDVSMIREHPDHFCGLGGDMADNFTPQFKDKSVVVNQLQPAQIQLIAVEKVLEYLQGKIVACIGGNHDRMDAKQTGIDARYFIQRDKDPAWLPHGGMVTLTVGKTEYKILWKHSYRFKSALNKFNSHHRMVEMLAPDADIAVQEHEHNPGIESLEVGEFPKRTQINIRTGSYKIDDGYSIDFWKSGRMGPQTVILWPDKKKILALHGKDAIKDAQTFLAGLK